MTVTTDTDVRDGSTQGKRAAAARKSSKKKPRTRAGTVSRPEPMAMRVPYRLHRQAAPHYAVGLLAFSACASRAVVHLSGAEAEVALSVAAAAFVGAVVVAFLARRKLDTKPARRWARVCAIAAGGWLTWVTGTGLSWDAVGLLAAIGYAVALPWWRAHRLPNTPTVPAVAGPGLDEYAAAWAAHIGGPGGEVPGSKLGGREEIPAGLRYVLEMAPGKHTYASVVALHAKLRAGLLLTQDQDLIIERHPVLDESRLLVTVVTNPPVAPRGSIRWPGPVTYAHGRIALGPYVDGEGLGRWRLYTENSMWGGFITGITGVGKSRVLDGISLAAAAAGNTVVWYGDGQDGASTPGLVRWYDWCADTTNARVMFAAALLIMEFRQAENLVDELEGFTPSPERPGLLIVLDECHRFFTDELVQAAAARIARAGRKCGVSIIAASQIPNVGVFGQGDLGTVLRSCLTAGNLAAMHTTQRGAGNLIPGIDIDPTTLPSTPGYIFLAARGPGARSAAVRGYYVADPKAESTLIPMPGLDVGSQTAASAAYRLRHTAAEARRDLAAMRVAAMRAGIDLGPFTGTKENGSVVEPTGATVIAFPTWPTRPAEPAPSAATGALTRSKHGVLVAIANGHDRPAAIVERTGLSERQVHNLLGQLDEDGLIVRHGYGRYALTDNGHQALQRLAS